MKQHKDDYIIVYQGTEFCVYAKYPFMEGAYPKFYYREKSSGISSQTAYWYVDEAVEAYSRIKEMRLRYGVDSICPVRVNTLTNETNEKLSQEECHNVIHVDFKAKKRLG